MGEAFGLHALLDAAPDAILGVDRTGEIRWVNAALERLFGYEHDELVGQPVDVLVPPGLRVVHRAHFEAYVANPHSRPMGNGRQLAALRKDGTEFPAEISLSAVETNEGLLVSALIRDLSKPLEVLAERERLEAQTERERLQRRLEQSQRLESLGELAGGVAHDFNNLLSVILNYAQFVADELEAADASDGSGRWQRARDDVAQIVHAGERAAALTQQLLAFARREVLHPEVIDLNTVISETERLLTRSLGEHVTLETRLDDELWRVLADPGRVEQVLVNLALNARDAMPEGGTLTVDTHNVTADDEYALRHPGLEPGRYVRCRVSDTGEGMTAEVRRRAFEPFFTTKPSTSGTGLGLATVHGIVNQAGGSVQIYSEPDMGTTVSVLLPATDQEIEQSTPRPQTVAAPCAGLTILVVEDEDALREVTVRTLTRAGYEVVAAANGAEALEASADADRVDLLLTDVVMPAMLGKELAERLTQERPGLHVLYMSGYAQPVLASSGQLDAGVRLVEKPFTAPELLAAVCEQLEAEC